MAQGAAQNIVPNEIIVKLNQAADLAAAAAQYGLSVAPIDQFGAVPIYRLRVLNNGNVSQIAQAMRNDTTRIAYADPNYIVGAPNSSKVQWSIGGSANGFN